MSSINTAAGEKIAVVGTVDPSTVNSTQKYTDVVDMSKFHQALGIVLLGDMANETIDFKAYSCDSDGSNKVALKSATQLAASASANDNAQVVISVRGDDLAGSGKRHIVFGIVTGGGTGGTGAVVALGLDARHGPASDNDLASVLQVKL